MSESPADLLERWECCGGTWRIRSLAADAAEIDLCSCHGEAVDVLCSTDARFLALLEERLRSDPSRRSGGAHDGDHA
jgi:hypothetical protein